ncbi:hypothetical protein PTKIN_Ptkin06aG0056400 [Pterospermum kingtungense]
MDLERGSLSSFLTSRPGDAAEDVEVGATDQMEMEAAEILAALAHSTKRDVVSVAAEFAAKWGCKGKRVRKRLSSSESPPSDIGSNPVQSGSDLAEDQATAGLQQIQLTSSSIVIESVESEQNVELFNKSNPCAARYTSDGVVRLRQNVNEDEKDTHTLHRTLTNNESDWQMIRERQVLYNIVGVPEKDIWEDGQQDEMTGNNALMKLVKAEENAESVKSSPSCVAKHMSGGGRRSRQNLTEAEKEARRLRRILANRESARQTIRRRQAKESALKEYQSQESTNKSLKAEMAKAIKDEEDRAPEEVKLAHEIFAPSRNYPFFIYNQHHFPPFCWPSIVQSSHPIQSPCGHQNAIVFPSSISTPSNGMLASSHDQENPINVNGPKNPLYVVPYPWFFSLPDHGNGLHPQPACGSNNIKDETSVNNRFSTGCSLKSSFVREEEYNSSLPIKAEKDAYGSVEASPDNLNCTPVRLSSDGGGQCTKFQIKKEEGLVPTPLCSAGTTSVIEQENMQDHVVNTEVVPIRACHFVGALPEENQESTNCMSKKALDAVAAAEARKRRKELTKLKNFNGRQCRVHR